jgi:TatD DNase family protein
MIDFHCHLDLYPDPQAVVRRAAASGVYVLSVTTTPRAWKKTAALSAGLPRIRTALGLHPQLAHERHGELALFEEFLGQTRYVGEVGLDGSPEMKQHAAIQRKVFDRILSACARSGGRVLSIHSRRATEAVLEALRRHPECGIPILHWFSGTKAQLDEAIALGCWFSVGPAMLAGARGAALAAAIPRERVLTETDGPFAMTNGRALEPDDVGAAEAALSTIWGLNIKGVREILLLTLTDLSSSSSAFGGERSPLDVPALS